MVYVSRQCLALVGTHAKWILTLIVDLFPSTALEHIYQDWITRTKAHRDKHLPGCIAGFTTAEIIVGQKCVPQCENRELKADAEAVISGVFCRRCARHQFYCHIAKCWYEVHRSRKHTLPCEFKCLHLLDASF